MKKGRFYFVLDDFYDKYDFNKTLMRNKEADSDGTLHNRPCFFAFPDKNQSKIYWLVPLSTKHEKYQKIFDSKMEKLGKCNTIRFGDVLGIKNAFLIQNMFPITQPYINSVFIDRNTNNEVTVAPEIEKDVISNAQDVLRLAKRKIPVLYADVMAIYNGLLAEIEQAAKGSN
ncbi:MAG: hypothetical protein LBC86_00790 [Oscillospiraceae bacterium]|jgi:hypothetical protein|nr:hypothetical protein [Oscillospiraceae bacterium]